MRFARFAFALLGLSAVLVAADPFVGTWKLNLAKSKYKSGAKPKGQTATISESGNDVDVILSSTFDDDTSFTWHYTIPAHGGQGKVIDMPYDGVTSKWIAANEREVQYLKDGKTVITGHSKLSANRNTLTSNVTGVDMQGNPIDFIAVYDRQ